MNINNVDYAGAVKYINANIGCKKWASIFKNNVEDKGGSVAWKLNIDGLAANMNKH